MNSTRFALDVWLLHSAAGGTLLLLLCWAAMRCCRQPAWRQRLGEWGLAGALLLPLLSLIPAWLILPVLPVEASSGAADLNAPPFPAPLSSPAPMLERNFSPPPKDVATDRIWDRTSTFAQDNALAMANPPRPDDASHFLPLVTLPPSRGSEPITDVNKPATVEKPAPTSSSVVVWSSITTGLRSSTSLRRRCSWADGFLVIGRWVISCALHGRRRARWPGSSARWRVASGNGHACLFVRASECR